MKKLYFLFLTLLITSVSFGQTTVDFDTGGNWSPSPSGYGDYTYVDGDFTATGLDVLRQTTGAQDGFAGALGTYSIRLRNNTSTSLTMIISSGGISTFSFQVRRWDGSPDTNFSVETTTDGSNWSASSTINNTVTDDSDWKTVNGSINSASTSVGVRIVSNGTTERIMVDDFTWTGFSTTCGVALGAASTVCNANTVGDNNDSVTINIPYTGSDTAITNVTTTSGGTVGGDDPSSVADGTITITGLLEGAAWDIALVGGDCGAISTSGSVAAAECDPIPNTCYDLSGGAELLEIVTVAANSDMDVWTESSGTYTINGFCGGGCMEESNGWLVFGPLDMTSVSDLSLLFDAAEGFDGSTLDVQYTSDYSNLCPDGASWTSAGVISDAGSQDIDLSAATGTNVFVGIQYLDSDGTFSSWTLDNVSLAAFGTCPTLGTRPTSNCAVCDLTLQTETYVCQTNTTGDNNDSVTVEIPYTGSETSGGTLSTTSGGTVSGDISVSDSMITISGLTEGDAWDLTITGGDCDGTTVSGTIPASVCDPVTMDLVINEILADPHATTGDANGDGTINTSADEFIEFYNVGTGDLDISGYTVEDASSVRHTFPTSTIIPAGGFLTLFGNGTPTGISGISQVASSGSVGLNNGGDTVTVKNVGGAIVVTETYTGVTDQSICREPDFTGAFVGHLSHTTNPVQFTPGVSNDTVLSITKDSIEGFAVYPNPVNNGEFTVSTLNNADKQIQIFDMLGKLVYQKDVQANESVQVSNLNSGIYILKVKEEGKIATRKLVIE